ncbi:MAG: geranyl transferase [Firmicutes bacterium HGW-Firmicutes-21]|nr:MAG: geranyl transferase [Firmicutes bacterium HGW-Firmicutes-21]
MTLKEAMSHSAEQIEGMLYTLLTPIADINHSKLFEAMRYSVMAGGKRIRPYLVTEFCVLHGGMAENSLPYAAAVEMLHTMSLIHDDLPAMDNDVLRRGKPTNHVVFGEATAILAGDALLTEAFNALSSNKHLTAEQNLEAVTALARFGGVNGMMGGQQIDLQSENISVPIEVLDDLVSKKTAALLSCSCLLGCIAANASSSDKEKAVEYGHNLGVAFQITDDILDMESDNITLGKSIGKDNKDGKSTYVSLLGIDRAKALAYELTQNAKKIIGIYEQNASARRLFEMCDLLLNRKK